MKKLKARRMNDWEHLAIEKCIQFAIDNKIAIEYTSLKSLLANIQDSSYMKIFTDTYQGGS